MQNKINNKVLASYSMVALPIGAMAMPIAIYLPPLYSGSLGLTLATVGMIFTLARVWDLVTDPIMGIVIDRYGSRWGQYKHWVALAIPMVMLAIYKIFIPNPADVTAIYLGFWMLVLYLGYTMLSIAHNSWGSFLANDYDERSRLFGWREIFIIIGMVFVLAIPATMDFFGQSGTPDKVAGMGLFCLILFPLTVIPTLVAVPDKVAERKEALGWRDMVALLRSNPCSGVYSLQTSPPRLRCPRRPLSTSFLLLMCLNFRTTRAWRCSCISLLDSRHARVAEVRLPHGQSGRHQTGGGIHHGAARRFILCY